MTFPLCYTALQVISPEECQQIIDLCTPYLEDGLVQEGKPGQVEGKTNPTVRSSKVVLMPADDPRFESIKPALIKVVNAMVELSTRQFALPIIGVEAIQFSSYEEGDFYDYHLDSSTTFPRSMSASLLLSSPSDFAGGCLKFRDLIEEDEKPVEQTLQQSELAVFPSLLIHKVTPVTRGRRFSLVLWGFTKEVHEGAVKLGMQQRNTDDDGFEYHNEPNNAKPDQNNPMIF